MDDSLQLDYKNRWTDIEIYVVQNIIPAIKRAVSKNICIIYMITSPIILTFYLFLLFLLQRKRKASKRIAAYDRYQRPNAYRFTIIDGIEQFDQGAKRNH